MANPQMGTPAQMKIEAPLPQREKMVRVQVAVAGLCPENGRSGAPASAGPMFASPGSELCGGAVASPISSESDRLSQGREWLRVVAALTTEPPPYESCHWAS